jgi:hypothetical protein
VLELILEDAANRRPEGSVGVDTPHAQVLPHPVDLDCLQDEVHRRRPEQSAGGDEHGEPEPAAPVEPGQAETEEVLPEREVPGLDRNQSVQD